MSAAFPNLGLSAGEGEPFAVPLAAYLPPEVPRGESLVSAAAKMLEFHEELASPEVVKRRAARFGVSEELAKETLREIPGRGKLIVGLRYRKLNPNFPFAHLTPGFDILSRDIEPLKQLVPQWYQGLSLKGFTLRTAPALVPPVGFEHWSHALFGHTSEVPALEIQRGLEIRWETSCDFFTEYDREYKNFLRQNPEKNAFLHAEDRESLEEAIKGKRLLSLYDQQGWAGVISGREQDFYGLGCLYIFEIFLVERLRGKGIAAPFEARFLRDLSARFPFVYGHISNANPASLRTAKSLGRREVESELFIPL